jgi:carbamoyltransferase
MKQAMHILGLNAYHADSSAAIFRNGEMIAATEEERFTRIKHWAGFPAQAIQFCLKEANISLHEVDYITIGRDPHAKFGHKLKYLLQHPSVAFGAIGRLKNSQQVASLEEEFRKIDPAIDSATLKRKIKNIEHHRSHLASAFFASPFEKAAILSIDGSGDFTTTMIATGKGNKIHVIDSLDFPVSCGLFYTAFTQFLGFPHYGDEYKVMGLAPYGEPKYTSQVKKLLKFLPNGLFDWHKEYFVQPTKAGFAYINHIPSVGNLFSSKFIDAFGPARTAGQELTQYHKDLASSVQKVTEELIFHILSHLRKRTGLESVCIAGGVAQNSVANGKVAAATGFKNVYIPSAGHDAGISMGSALYLHNHILELPRSAPIFSAYTGSQFSNDEIEKVLTSRNIEYRFLHDEELFETVARKLMQPGVVGWFTGRAEFGPRALGGRSILADPRNPEAKNLLNLKIKRRENFRPFAPSILKEFSSEYFLKDDPVPFMEKVFPIRPEKHALIPAVTHVDGTGRLQTVDKHISPRYYALIETFRKKTGIPILLNTSFNENEPIVNTPSEALDCFLRTQMDMLVLENCVIERQ